jgi:hypothetical protein
MRPAARSVSACTLTDPEGVCSERMASGRIHPGAGLALSLFRRRDGSRSTDQRQGTGGVVFRDPQREGTVGVSPWGQGMKSPGSRRCEPVDTRIASAVRGSLSPRECVPGIPVRSQVVPRLLVLTRGGVFVYLPAGICQPLIAIAFLLSEKRRSTYTYMRRIFHESQYRTAKDVQSGRL